MRYSFSTYLWTVLFCIGSTKCSPLISDLLGKFEDLLEEKQLFRREIRDDGDNKESFFPGDPSKCKRTINEESKKGFFKNRLKSRNVVDFMNAVPEHKEVSVEKIFEEKENTKTKRGMDLLIMEPDVHVNKQGRVVRDDFEKLNHISQEFRDLINKNMSNAFSGSPPILELPLSTTQTSCSEDFKRKNSKKYMRTVCKRLPKKIVCRAGSYTFLINNGDFQMEPKTVGNFVGILYKRIQEGDKNFLVSVEEFPPLPCGGSVPKNVRRKRGEGEECEPPVIVECTPVSIENVKMCNPYEEPFEIIFECHWHSVSSKKKRTVSGMKFPCPTEPLNVRMFDDKCRTTPASKECPSAPTRYPATPCCTTCYVPTTQHCPLTGCPPCCQKEASPCPSTCPSTCETTPHL